MKSVYREEQRSLRRLNPQLSEPFKKCTLCGKVWQTKEDFLNDKKVILNGYQWNIKKIRLGQHSPGLLVFTHRIKECGTSIAIWASSLKDKN